jgi:hypothetical protein
VCARARARHVNTTGARKQRKKSNKQIGACVRARARVYVWRVLRCPYTYESGSRVRLGSGSSEPNSSVCGAPRAGLASPPARYWLVRVWVMPSQARVSTRPHAQTVRVLSLKAMSASTFKTFTSPDFLTKFLEECRELPVLWQVRSADYSNRANGMSS